MAPKTYRFCKWLIEKLLKKRYMTFEEINEEWKNDRSLSNGVELLRKTFYNNRKTLKESFGIEIVCRDNGGYHYFIKNPEIIRDDKLKEWLLNSLCIDEHMMDCKSLAGRILLENIPSGGNMLECITKAMLGGYKLRFIYAKYGSPDVNEHTAEPWGLVLYHQRWYVLVSFGDEKKYTFALDRMNNLEMTSEKFEIDPEFKVTDYFGEFYGIYNSGRDKTKIVLRAYDDEAYYLRDLPIHKSQREIGSGNGYTDFMIELRPNKELIALLLSRRERLKVQSPDSIIDDMKAALDATRANYS